MMTFSNFTLWCRTWIMEWICTLGKKESRHTENTWFQEPRGFIQSNAKTDSRNSHPSFKPNVVRVSKQTFAISKNPDVSCSKVSSVFASSKVFFFFRPQKARGEQNYIGLQLWWGDALVSSDFNQHVLPQDLIWCSIEFPSTSDDLYRPPGRFRIWLLS